MAQKGHVSTHFRAATTTDWFNSLPAQVEKRKAEQEAARKAPRAKFRKQNRR